MNIEERICIEERKIEFRIIPIARFKENEIVFFQDMQWWQRIPSGVDFTVTKVDNGYKFVGDGYGILGGNYGNGAIYVSNKNIPDYFHQWYDQQIKQP